MNLLHIFQLRFSHNCPTPNGFSANDLHIFDVNFLAKAISLTRNALILDEKKDFLKLNCQKHLTFLYL